MTGKLWTWKIWKTGKNLQAAWLQKRSSIQDFLLAFGCFIFCLLFICGFRQISGQMGQGRAATPQKCYTSIRLARGDTLWSIADKYGAAYHSYDAYIMEVKAINHLADDGLREGGYLTIPYYTHEE